MADLPQLLLEAYRLAQQKNVSTPSYQILGRQFGPSGALLGALMDIFRVGGSTQADDVRRASKVMRDAGFSLSPGQVKSVKLAEPWQAIDPVGRGGRFNVDVVPGVREIQSPPIEQTLSDIISDPSPFPSRTQPPEGAYDIPHRKSTGLVKRVTPVATPGERRQAGIVYREPVDPAYNEYILGGMMPPKQGEVDIFEQEIMTPESSNVFSFTYDEKRGILYITFRAPGDIVKKSKSQSVCTGREYTMGHRAFARGPMYAYGSAAKPVPKSVFDAMQSASSKGKFVWERFKVCGSLWQHQYPVSLVSPSMEGILYVPRKVTRRGFRVRAVPMVGRGKRPYLLSNLPEALK